jgi:uncharacterized ferritin-like protein (DUF455 family)
MKVVVNPDDVDFAAGPARDKRFRVVDFWSQCNNLSEDHPGRETEFFHRQMNEEINGMECAARSLTDFPSADWDTRMRIARQCYDEARHVEMFRDALVSRGGYIGQAPVLNFQYRIVTNIDHLCGRLAVQNRSFETEGVDAIEPEIAAAQNRGDPQMAQRYDAQLADEIGHVRFANDYLSREISKDKGVVMRIGRALNYAFDAFAYVMGRHAMESVRYGVNRLGRREAGFSEEEIRQAVELRAKRATRGTE